MSKKKFKSQMQLNQKLNKTLIAAVIKQDRDIKRKKFFESIK